MNFRAYAAKALIVLAGVTACFALAAPATSAKASKAPVFWIDLTGRVNQHPRVLFFTANSGPQVYSLKWTGWGSNRAVGRGIYRVTSPPPPGGRNPRGPARIVTWKPVICVPEFGNRAGKRIRVYRRAKLLRPVTGGGRRWTDISAHTGWLNCK